MVLALGMVLILSAFGTPKRFDFNLDWNVQPCALDDLGSVSFPSIAGIVTDNGIDPLDYANGMSNPLFSSSFFSPLSIPTSSHWSPPLMQDKIAETYLARGVSNSRLSGRLTGKTVFKDSSILLPVVSIIADVRGFFSPSDGIYVQGKDWYNSGKENLFKSWFMRKGNYSRRGALASRDAYLQLFDSSKNELYAGAVSVRIHGNATRSFPQKSLRISSGKDQLVDFWGNRVESYILRNGGNTWETTMMGDLLCQNIAAKSKLSHQKGQPCVVLINGYYWGIHNLRDRIKADNLAIKHACLPEEISIWEGWSFDKGNPKRGEKLQGILSKAKVNEPIEFSEFNKELDLKEFARYILLEVFFGNGDWPNNNFYMYKVRKGKWHPVLTDLDFCLGYNDIVQPESNGFDRMMGTGSSCKYLFGALLNHKEFLEILVKEHGKLSKMGLFDIEHYRNELQKLVTQLSTEIPRHNRRWRKIESKEKWMENIKKMENFYLARLKYFDIHFKELIETPDL